MGKLGHYQTAGAYFMRLENFLVMRWKLFLLVVIIVMTCSATLNAGSGKSESETFQGTISQVFNAAVKAVQSKWHITLLDRETETMSFDANSGLACSASFEELPGTSGVRVTLVSHAQNGAVGTFGMNGRIAKQLFKGIQDELSKQTKQPHD